jgi:hypothetical protein
MRSLGIGLCAAALLLAACNGSSSSGGGAETQCNPPSGTSTVLVYPAPGSTGIPDNFGLVVLGSSAALPGGYQAYVVNNTTNNAVVFNVVGVAPNPLPTPYATPTFPNPVYQASGNPGTTFVAGSSITVYLNNAASSCYPTLALGSFTVQ